MRFVLGGLVGCAIVLAVAACSSTGGASPSPAGGTGGTIEGPTWRLASVAQGGTLADVPAGVAVDATFAGGTVHGAGGCNAYNGPAVVSGATIKIGPIAATQMACQPPASDVETAYLAALQAAASFTATADALTLFDGAGAASLVFKAGPANPLEGDWIVTGYNNGAQAVVSPVAGITLTAVFTADAVSGNGGCNSYSGGYTLDGDAVTIGPLASTMKACDQSVMDQETQFLAALQVPATVEVNGANLTLRDADGAIQVTLAPSN